jgi:sugar lactone lactonase YvrE
MTTVASVWFRPPTADDGFLPEGPRAFGGGVAWVNIQAGAEAVVGHLHTLSWDGTRHRRFGLPARPGFALPTSRPGVVLAGCDKVVGLFDTATGEWTPLAAIPDTHPRTIINDAEVVPGGRGVVFGTKDVKFADPIAHLYLFTTADNRVSVLADGQTCSNGKVFAGGRTLYDIDTPRKVVTRYRFDPASRTIQDADIAIDLRHRDDFPDGMCDAGDGTVVVAFYNPNPVAHGSAVRYRLGTGEVLHEWHTPGSPRVTCPLLVRRPGGVKLVLTTAVEGMSAEQLSRCPNAGCLFVADATGCEPPAEEVVVV